VFTVIQCEIFFGVYMCLVYSSQEWLQYQSLWDMEMINITSRLEEQLSKWEKLLLDIKYVSLLHQCF